MKILLIFAFAAVLFVAGAFFFNSQIGLTASVSEQNSSTIVTDDRIYRHLFRHAAAFQAKAVELERQGKDASGFRNFFKHKAGLSEEQAQIFAKISSRCVSEIKAIDERAQPIIQTYKSQYPNGRVPQGQVLLPPPVELQLLSEERDAVVLRERDALRVAFGDEAFARFDNFVKSKVAPNVVPLDNER